MSRGGVGAIISRRLRREKIDAVRGVARTPLVGAPTPACGGTVYGGGTQQYHSRTSIRPGRMLVEAGGVEPPSENTPRRRLQAYPGLLRAHIKPRQKRAPGAPVVLNSSRRDARMNPAR